MEKLFMKRKMALMLSLCMVIAGSGSAYMVKAATIVPTIEPKQATTIQPLNTLTPSEQQELANAKPNLMPGIITETPNATPYLALETPIPFIRSEQPSHVIFDHDLGKTGKVHSVPGTSIALSEYYEGQISLTFPSNTYGYIWLLY